MKELIEIYELKLKNVEKRIEELQSMKLNQGTDYWDITKERLTTKKFEYMAFLDDLRRVCPQTEPIYKSNTINYCLFKKSSEDKDRNYYYVRITSAWSPTVQWSIGYPNTQGYISLVGDPINKTEAAQLEDEYFKYKTQTKHD